MQYLTWFGAVAAGSICLVAGIIGRRRSAGSHAGNIYFLAMSSLFVTTVVSPVSPLYGTNQSAGISVKVFVAAMLFAEAMLWSVTLVFPIDRKMSFRPLSTYTVVVILVALIVVVLSGFATVDFRAKDDFNLSLLTTRMIILNGAATIILATISLLRAMPDVGTETRRGAKIYLGGLWGLQLSALPFVLDFHRGIQLGAGLDIIKTALLIVGVGGFGAIFGVTIVRNQLMMAVNPVAERLVSSTKSQYKLLRRLVYLVEEPKPDFAFKMFTDILKGRCYDCDEDESFPCESIDCTACGLPCPCHTCSKYKSRTQGLIITRQFPNEVRKKHYIQTTPIIWLSTVQGKDNMDPGKLALLTDYLMNFMESSKNGVVLVEGIEYLLISNDFQRLLKAVDAWTESAMTSRSRLILSVDRKAFDSKELAMLERNRETVRPDARENWMIIPERI